MNGLLQFKTGNVFVTESLPKYTISCFFTACSGGKNNEAIAYCSDTYTVFLFLAFWVQSLDTFMSNAMASIYDKTENELNKIRDDFKQSMILSKAIFGREAFRKVYYQYDRLPPINKALFDAISVQFALINQSERDILESNKNKFKELLYNKLNNDGYFFTSITSSTGDKNRILKRHAVVVELINETISK